MAASRMTLLELFDRSLVHRRKEMALEFRGETYTFAEIEARSNRMARLLGERGLRPGDRLCAYLANSV